MERKRICHLVTWVLIMSLPFSMLGVGIKYKDGCEIDVPVYLIVTGLILIGIGTITPLLSIFTDQVFNTVEEAVKNLFVLKVRRPDKNICIVCLGGTFLLAASFAFPCVFFWGSVVVFGAYDKWTYNGTLSVENNAKVHFGNATSDFTSKSSVEMTNQTLALNLTVESENNKIFCDYTPFMFAFIVLLLQWIFIMLQLFCCGSLMACAGYSMRKAVRKGNLNPEDLEKLADNNR